MTLLDIIPQKTEKKTVVITYSMCQKYRVKVGFVIPKN